MFIVLIGIDAYGPFNTVRESKLWAEQQDNKVRHYGAYRIIQLMKP